MKNLRKKRCESQIVKWKRQMCGRWVCRTALIDYQAYALVSNKILTTDIFNHLFNGILYIIISPIPFVIYRPPSLNRTLPSQILGNYSVYRPAKTN